MKSDREKAWLEEQATRIQREEDARNVTANPERYRIFVLCECSGCGGLGKVVWGTEKAGQYARCKVCRGEGRVRQEVATAPSPSALGVALVTLGREGEFEDCPVGCLDSEGDVGQKWIIRPWLPSARNVSDAAKTLGKFSGEKRREKQDLERYGHVAGWRD